MLLFLVPVFGGIEIFTLIHTGDELITNQLQFFLFLTERDFGQHLKLSSCIRGGWAHHKYTLEIQRMTDDENATTKCTQFNVIARLL